jgi:hypothetical protein
MKLVSEMWCESVSLEEARETGAHSMASAVVYRARTRVEVRLP